MKDFVIKVKISCSALDELDLDELELDQLEGP